MKQSMDALRDIIYKLKIMGIPIYSPLYNDGDKKEKQLSLLSCII